jgi:AcrR family transcriptional regulator
MSGDSSRQAAPDRRTLRTRSAIVDAYNQLIRSNRQDSIRVSDIVAHANVGRSTFYEHYRGADDVFLEAVSRPLAVLADAAAGDADTDRLDELLAHFWENRQRAREMLSGRQGERIARRLGELVEVRLSGHYIIPQRLIAVQLAETAFAPVRAWIAAEASCTPRALAEAIRAATSAVRSALRA